MPPRIDRDARKAQLAEAVWQVIRERGIGAVSVRTVAEQAGVVVGSLRHVFPTRADLLRFSAELMVQRATRRIRAIARSGDDVQYALDVLEQMLPLESDSRAELEVNIALIAESPALPELATIRDHAHRGLAEVCARLVELLSGRPRDAHVVAQGRRLHAVVDGLATHLLVQDPSADTTWARDLLRAEVARVASETP